MLGVERGGWVIAGLRVSVILLLQRKVWYKSLASWLVDVVSVILRLEIIASQHLSSSIKLSVVNIITSS